MSSLGESNGIDAAPAWVVRSPPTRESAMNTKPETKNKEIETIATVDLDDVTGGCAACGCGNPGTAASGVATSAAANRSPLGLPFNRR